MKSTPFAASSLNNDLNPVFEWGFVNNRQFSDEEKRAFLAGLKLADVEFAATLLLAEWMELKIGEEIFSGMLPAYLEEGFAVKLNYILPSSDIDYRYYQLSCTGLHADHHLILSKIGELHNRLPLQDWLTIRSGNLSRPILFCDAYFNTQIAIETVTVNGQYKEIVKTVVEFVQSVNPAIM